MRSKLATPTREEYARQALSVESQHEDIDPQTTRLTNAFSKKWDNLKAARALYFAYYNFYRIHRAFDARREWKAVYWGCLDIMGTACSVGR